MTSPITAPLTKSPSGRPFASIQMPTAVRLFHTADTELACRQNPDMFFNPHRMRRAVSLCASCPSADAAVTTPWPPAPRTVCGVAWSCPATTPPNLRRSTLASPNSSSSAGAAKSATCRWPRCTMLRIATALQRLTPTPHRRPRQCRACDWIWSTTKTFRATSPWPGSSVPSDQDIVHNE